MMSDSFQNSSLKGRVSGTGKTSCTHICAYFHAWLT